jgi:ABC-2 type transport system permease protein
MNRGLWLFGSIAVLAVFGRMRRPLVMVPGKAYKPVKTNSNPVRASFSIKSRSVKGNFDSSTQALWLRIKFEFRHVVFDPAFYILCLCTLVMLLLVVAEPKGMFGNGYWPVSQHMISMGREALKLLGLIVITYYSAEIVWREKGCQMNEIMDSLPISNFIIWLSKLLAVCAVIVALVTVTSVFLICYQLLNDYHHIELGQYLISMFYFTALPMLMMACLALFCQGLAPNKYAGMSLFGLFILIDLALPMLGVEHNMLRFSHSPTWQYSDMNGYAGSIAKHSIFMLYWASITLCLVIISYGLWQRGPSTSIVSRVKNIKHSLSLTSRYSMALSLALFVIFGGVIYYNTYVLNAFFSKPQMQAMHAEYEKRYRQYQGMPIPTMTSLKANVAIYPQSQRLEINANIVFRNNTDQPISRFLVSIPGYNGVLDNVKGYSDVTFELQIAGGKLLEPEGPLNTHWFELTTPIQPREQRRGIFKTVREQQGFSHDTSALRILENGSFFQNSEVFPRYGYVTAEQLIAPEVRKKFALPEQPRANDLYDAEHYDSSIGESVLGINDGYLNFEVIVSTSIEQIAIAPGYLTRQWTENDRAYFHYKMDKPIANYFAFFSGQYEIETAQHNGVDLAVYYHSPHGMNVQRIMQAMKDSLDFYSAQFGPYQHTQMRVVEFSGPDNFGQDFPTVIAYSEASGFIHDQRNPDHNDQVYWFIAHEMAHQWWGAQLVGANVQGSTVLSETLAQYSAYALVQRTFGRQKVADMLEYELDRYLRGRSRETISERPLIREENQAYLHYNKGAIVMMSLMELLGEDRLNKGLKTFLTTFKSEQSVYPTTIDLMKHIKQGASDYEVNVINDLFGEIYLYDIAITDTKIEKNENGEFLITVRVNGLKHQADVHGKDQTINLDEQFDIALFNMQDDRLKQTPLYLGKHRIRSGENIIRIISQTKPTFIRIDPFVHFIDRDITDNYSSISF